MFCMTFQNLTTFKTFTRFLHWFKIMKLSLLWRHSIYLEKIIKNRKRSTSYSSFNRCLVVFTREEKFFTAHEKVCIKNSCDNIMLLSTIMKNSINPLCCNYQLFSLQMSNRVIPYFTIGNRFTLILPFLSWSSSSNSCWANVFGSGRSSIFPLWCAM